MCSNLFSALHTLAPQICLAFFGFKLLKLLSNFNDHFHSPKLVQCFSCSFASFLGNCSPSGKSTTQNIQIRSPVCEKTPVQNPKSPISPILRKETGRASKYEVEFSRESGLELAKEGGRPVQETPNPKKSLDLSEAEELKGRPVQESFNPENSAAGTLQTNESLQHVEEFSEGKPVQETEDPPSEKLKVGIEEQRDEGDQQPIQETQGPAKEHETGTTVSSQVKGGEVDREEVLETKPPQESASPNVESECTKEEALPTQETMAAGKGPFEETGQGTETEKTSEVMEGEEDHEELSERTPLQESANSNVETEFTKEEALPTQETMAAGKGPFEETGIAQVTETEERILVREGEEDHEELSERTPLQESANSNVETECIKEEALPTQETMAAGKGPFEETGQAARSLVEEGEKDHEELSERTLLQESANPNMETKCTKEEALPTQETLAAGKGPFEETGLEVGVKGQPTDEQY